MYHITTAVHQVKEATDKKVRTPSEVKDLFPQVGYLSQESFNIATLNAKNNVIDTHLITLGVVDASLVHPREVFKAAIMDSACAIVLVHNHPSGDPTPSAEDLRLTKLLVQAGKIMDIRILDHIIIAHDKTLSIREEGLVDFSC